MRLRRTGFRQNDAHTAYLEMGRPATMTDAQIARLQSLTADAPIVSMVRVKADGRTTVELPMRDNDVVMVELSPS
jgi:xylan 1,4-beta-xylosidase